MTIYTPIESPCRI